MKHRIKRGFNYLEQSPMVYAHGVSYFMASLKKTTSWPDRNIIKTYSEQYSPREWQRLRRAAIKGASIN